MRKLEEIEKELHQAAALRNFTPTDDPDYQQLQDNVSRLHAEYQRAWLEKKKEEQRQREVENNIRMGLIENG